MGHLGKAWGLIPGINLGVKCLDPMKNKSDALEGEDQLFGTQYNYVSKLMLTMPKHAWRTGAVSNDEWGKSTKSKYWRQLFSTFFHLVEMIIKRHSEESKEDTIRYKKWVATQPVDGEAESAPFVASNLGGEPVRVFMEHVFKSEEVDRDSTVSSEDAVPVVVAYRFYVFVMFEVEIGELFWEMIESNMALHAACADKTGRTSKECDLNAAIQPHQYYKHISSVEHWAKAVAGTYLDSDEFQGGRLVEGGGAGGDGGEFPLNVRRNWSMYFKAHPSNVFSFRNGFYRTKCIDKTSKNALQLNPLNYGIGSTEWEFPIVDAVMRMSCDQASNNSMFNKYFIDYQRYRLMRAQIEIASETESYFLSKSSTTAAYADNEYANFLPDGGGRTHEEKWADERKRSKVMNSTTLLEYGKGLLEGDALLEALMVSDFRNLAAAVKRERIHASLTRHNLKSWRERYVLFQERLVHEFQSRCWSTDSSISGPAKAIVEFYNRKFPIIKAPPQSTSNLSVFGDIIHRRMTQLEKVCFVSTAHRPLLLLLTARNDAYRDSHGLHFNMVFTGEGATSKSFLLETMAACSIEDTAEIISYETSKANAIDGPRNDQINIFNEAPPGTLTNTKANSSSDKATSAQFKERLTSNKVNVKTFFQREGSYIREQRMSKSECIGSWFGATNDPVSGVEDALRTRFHWVSFEQKNRPGMGIPECTSAVKNQSSSIEGRAQRYAFQEAYKQEQMVLFIAEKLISCGIMKQVYQKESDVIFSRFESAMSKAGHSCAPRDQKRLKIIARILTLVYAFECTFKIPGGACYDKETFEVKDVLQMEPLLYIIPEIAYFSIELLSDQYFDPSKDKVLDGIRSIVKSKFYEGGVYMEEMYSDGDFSGKEDAPTKDYNYIELPYTQSQLKAKIFASIPTSLGRPSGNNINHVLYELAKKNITHQHYDDTDKLTGLPTCCERQVQNTGAVLATSSKKGVKVHSGLLFGHEKTCDKDVLKNILKELSSANTKPGTYITARLYTDPDSGYLHYDKFCVEERVSTGEQITMANPLYCGAAAKATLGIGNSTISELNSKTLTWKGHLEDISRARHCQSIGIPIEDSAIFSPTQILSNRIKLETRPTQIWDYPEGWDELKSAADSHSYTYCAESTPRPLKRKINSSSSCSTTEHGFENRTPCKKTR
mgnify:CR=1 FL=1|jgi:hypothetical protein|tara:strand:+ start:197 stop:3709 length:3513 start_codon:yes stop_codon:yes gene_type:complete